MSMAALAALDDGALRKKLGVSKARVAGIFRPLLGALAAVPAGNTVTPEGLAVQIGRTPKQVNEALTAIVAVDFSVFDKTTEYLPDTVAMIQLLEHKLGLIDSNNLSTANELCKNIVDAAVKPRYESFIRRGAVAHLDGTGTSLTIPVADLVEHLRGDYRVLAKAQDNGNPWPVRAATTKRPSSG